VKDIKEGSRRYSRKFDGWDPPSFETSERQIGEAIARCDEQLVRDTGGVWVGNFLKTVTY
jgi:hypothetical protein